VWCGFRNTAFPKIGVQEKYTFPAHQKAQHLCLFPRMIPKIRQGHAARFCRLCAGDFASLKLSTATDNEQVAAIYKQYLEDTSNGHEAHRLLHTHYAPRPKIVKD